jgi:prepilin-type N-terminal cleavage/methylation domain-containing protein/prepilin-type processing-associated H-X9-DG protein
MFKGNVVMKKKGFTLIELLVVIAVIALLLSIIMPALGKAKLYAQKIICRSNERQQALGAIMYAQEHDSKVPTYPVGAWLWDLSFISTYQISEYAGFDDNDIFFCPANRLKKPDDARFWQFSWLVYYESDFGTPDKSQPVPLLDEDTLPTSGAKSLQSLFRVMPTLYMFDGGSAPRPTTLLSGKKAEWINKLSDLKATSSRIMLMDNVISASDKVNFFEIQAGTIGSWGGFDNSNHASNKRFTGTTYLQPDGANIAYADGHVDWRDFEVMQPQLDNGVLFWW